jgi:hypothetical protein
MSAHDTAGYYAAEGTAFHALIAEWQQTGNKPNWLGTTYTVTKPDTEEVFEIEVDDDMYSFAEVCLERYANIPGDRFYEIKVDISSLTPIEYQGGTADLIICSLGVLDVVDWKFGTGIQVYAKNNSQLLLYAWGALQSYDNIYHFQTIRMHIAQPRLNHFDVYEISRSELTEWSEWARERAALAWQPNADRSPSPGSCLWCKVRLTCPAMEVARQALADLSFDVLENDSVSHEQQQSIAILDPPKPRLEPPVQLTTEQLAKLLRWRGLMERWFAQAADELITRGLQGDDLGGLWKVVEGRSRRRWKDEEEAAEGLARLGIDDDDIYVRKVVSPNQSEKLVRAAGVRGKLTKAYVGTLVERPPGKPTLVAVGDNRAEVGSIVDESFEGDEL